MLKRALLLTLSLTAVKISFACTDYASVNGENNTVMITKNRDEFPDLQSILAVHPTNGYAFMGLFSQQKTNAPYVVRAAINQYGLSIVNMGAGVLKGYRGYDANRYDDGDDFMRDVLTHYKTIGEVLINLPALVASHPYPEFYLLADQQEIALIELAPNQQYQVTLSNSAPLYHTNNYESPAFSQYNLMYAESSLNRYSRISDLMNSNKTYSFNTFLTFAHDHVAGTNDSIFRTNVSATQAVVKTLATFIASIPKDGSAPNVYIQFYPTVSMNGPAYTYTLDSSFWSFTGVQKVLAVEARQM